MSLNAATMEIVIKKKNWARTHPEEVRKYREAKENLERKNREMAKALNVKETGDHTGSGAFMGHEANMSIVVGNDGSPFGGIIR